MMKNLLNRTQRLFLLFLCSFSSLFSFSQVQTARFISTSANSNGFYEYLPQGYGTGSDTYPVLIFLHGSGEVGNGSAAQLPKVLNTGLPSLIKNGGFPVSFTVNSQTFKFIVISPQFVAWPSLTDVDAVVNYVLSHYRVDPKRLYITGLSMGGGPTWEYTANPLYIGKVAGIVPIAGASYPAISRAYALADAKMPVWGTVNSGDPTGIAPYMEDYVSEILARNPSAPAKISVFNSTSHDAWTHTYDPNFRENGLNVYEWLLQFQKGTVANVPPVVNAGPDVSLTLPTNSYVGKATATDAGGSIAKYAWTKGSGPTTFTISNTAILNPTFSNLLAGLYTFRLTVTDNQGATSFNDFNITVNAAPVALPVANAGADKAITLPVNSVTLTGTGTETGGTISSYLWTKISGPAATIASATAATTAVTSLLAGVYSFELKVTDSKSAVDRDTVVVTVSPAASQGGGSAVRVNVYGGTLPYNNAAWNNWNVATNGTAATTNVNSGTLKFENGTYSTVSAVLSQSQAVKDNGATYSAGMAPAEVLRTVSYSSVDRRLTIAGLNPTKSYSLEFYASRAASGNPTIFTIGTTSVTINTYNNFATKASFANVMPSAQGEIVVLIKKTATFNYLNGFSLAETGTTTLSAVGEQSSSALFETATEDAGASAEMLIYPNPVSDQFTVKLNNDYHGTMSIRLVNMSGQVVKEFSGIKDSDLYTKAFTIGQQLPRGTYIVQVKIGDWTGIRKVLKQ